jgi:hypothetical protein
MGFYFKFIKDFYQEFDKGEFIAFPRDYYNIAKTSEGKFIGMGNLEEKFQENFKKAFKNNYATEPSCENKELTIDQIREETIKHKRDDLFIKVKIQLIQFYGKNTCVTPILTLEEALKFQKNLNQSIDYSDKMSNSSKLDALKEIEDYLFPNNKSNILVDLSPRILVEASPKTKF